MVNRAAVEEAYEIERGRITSPGKFEGQKLYVPYFWSKVLEGWQDDEDADGTPVFYVTSEDRTEFPEIHPKVKQIRLIEQDSGFIIER
jgi:hypothetical protein